MVSDVRGDVVEDGGSPGTGGVAGGGVNLRRLLRRLHGSDDEIGGLWWLMWSGGWSRRSSERRGCRWCEELREGSAPFIAARRGRGAAQR
jgi:hypothetical protein